MPKYRVYTITYGSEIIHTDKHLEQEELYEKADSEIADTFTEIDTSIPIEIEEDWGRVMEITLDLIRKIAKDIIDEQGDDKVYSRENRGEKLALRMLIQTLEDMQKKDK